MEDGASHKRCGIWYRKAGTVYVIDVSVVVEPCSIAHLDKHSDRDEEAAAKVQEKVKQRHYTTLRGLSDSRGGRGRCPYTLRRGVDRPHGTAGEGLLRLGDQGAKAAGVAVPGQDVCCVGSRHGADDLRVEEKFGSV